MFYSKKYKLLFVASPKSGTRSVHDFLERLDPEGSRREINLSSGKKITSAHMPNGIIGHARARDLKVAIGKYHWNNLCTFLFVRDPREKLVSAYSFNKTRNLQELKFKSNFNSLKTIVSILSAKLLPFWLYMLFYRMKTNYEYCCDEKGKIIVNYIGRTKHLNDDFSEILQELKINHSKIENIKHINRSASAEYLKYYNHSLVRALFTVIYEKEIRFYDSLNNQGVTKVKE